MPGLRSSPGEGKGYPLQYSGLEKFDGLYSPWDHKESDNTTEQLSLSLFCLVQGERRGRQSKEWLEDAREFWGPA